jgi:hypothetical protein
VALLAVLATLYTLFFILYAETPLGAAMQVAVELQKASPKQAPRGSCAAALKGADARVDKPLLSFDGRWSGYGKAEATTILCAMNAKWGDARQGIGKEVYLTRHFPYDMVFPLLYGPALAGLYLYLLTGLGARARWPKYLALVPIAGAALDIAENLVVRTLVLAGLPPDETLVRIASALTVSKCVLFAASVTGTLGLLLWALVRQSFTRQA